MKENNYRVYVHYGVKNIPFYVGMACDTSKYRHNAMSSRCNEWKNMAKKKLTVKIVSNNLTKSEARELESALIRKLKKISDGGTLVNKSDGHHDRPRACLVIPIMPELEFKR